jgi:competence protein ComEA
MKQNLSEAKWVTSAFLVILTFLAFGSGCAKRARKYSIESRSETAYLKAANAGVNINTARVEELDRLPGIGKVMAERIIEHRTEHGPFRRIEHIMMVRGISERKFQAIESLITVQQAP